jgi:DNA adenine methylase
MFIRETSIDQPNLPGLPRTVTAAPFLKWVVGKRQLAKQILRFAPAGFTRYLEPFLSGGTVFFTLHACKNLLNDANEKLMLTYRVVQADVTSLIHCLQQTPHNEVFLRDARDRPGRTGRNRAGGAFYLFERLLL